MKINRDGIQDYQGDTNIERVCDHCSGDMLGFEGGYLDIGKKKRVSLGGPAYDHKKQDARFKVHVGLFPDGVDASESFDICGRCIRKALYDASEYLGKKAKVEDRVPGTPMPRQTKDSHAVAAAAPESPGGCRIRPVLVWLPNDDLDTASTTAEKYVEVIEERDSLQRQLAEVTAQKEEWRKLFGDQAIDFFGFLAKVEQAKAKNEGGLPLHDAFLKVGLTELYELAKTEANRTNDEFEDVLKETRSELERATDLHNLYERRYNDVCRQRDDAEFRVEVATEAAELAWGTVNTWSREELFEKAELAVHRRNKDKDNTIPF